ncbi:CRISPR-associated endonuclease Cas2 [Ruminococcaceae bacterium OttesenSCG-928-A16]|nr:CRISPR-associated endonuclease Cas2 [Ruminococcaceae bacterium OttesenSCG-928-A16]
MFVVLAYDVGAKRVSKVMKACRRYLFHVQNSVFEGSITEAQLKKLKIELEKKIEKETDSICIYEFGSVKYSRKEQIGAVAAYSNIID